MQLPSYPKAETHLEVTWQFEDGSTWRGDALKDGKPCGVGVFTLENGCAWRAWHTPLLPNGEFKNGLLYGYGNITKPDGYSYVGQCWKNQPHGKGMFRNDQSGHEHDGGFYDGVANGPGVEKLGHGVSCTRRNTTTTWNMGEKDGYSYVVEHVFKDGKSRVVTLKGEHCKDKREGSWYEKTTEMGRLVEVWQGEYQNDLKNGPCKQIVYCPLGGRTEFTGSNVGGKFAGRVEIRTYKGPLLQLQCTTTCFYVGGVKSGDGVIEWANGSKLTGRFVDGKKTGWFLAEQPDAPAQYRWYENDEEVIEKTTHLKRREERNDKGPCKKPHVDSRCGGSPDSDPFLDTDAGISDTDAELVLLRGPERRAYINRSK